MKLDVFLTTCALSAVLGSVQGYTQGNDKPKSQVIVEDGKEMTITGCVGRNPDGGYTLTNAAGKDGATASYILARLKDDDAFDDVKDHVGHRVEIKGTAADKGDGRLRVETDSGKTATKSEMKGDLSGLPFLGIKSLRMLASVCP
jgi:hypothetical protein